MYPGLPLLVFAGVALAGAQAWAIQLAARITKKQATSAHIVAATMIVLVVIVLLAQSYQQGTAGIYFIYNSQASMREMAEELTHLIPPNQPTNVLAYGGTSGALDLFARQRGVLLSFTEFRYAPDDNPEQYIIDQKIQFVVYPVGNAFAKAKYPYLARFETQTHGAVTFTPLTQFTTSPDNQMYSIWSVTY